MIYKAPDQEREYTFDWADWLDSGATISSVTFTADSGITLASPSNDDTTATVRISGGTAGEVYRVHCEVTGSDSDVDKRTEFVMVQDQPV